MAVVITPKDWGPFMWHTMYVIAIAAPDKPSEEECRAWSNFIRALEFLLACGFCRTEFKKIIEDNPPEKQCGRVRMVQWVLDAHNSVRSRQGKPPLAMPDVQRMIVVNHQKQQQTMLTRDSMYVAAGLLLGLLLAGSVVWWRQRAS